MASLISNMLAPSACRRLESCRLVVPDMYITYHTIPHHNITRHCIALLYITLRDITLHPLHILVHLCICCLRTCKTLKSQYPSIYYVNVYNMYIFIYIYNYPGWNIRGAPVPPHFISTNLRPYPGLLQNEQPPSKTPNYKMKTQGPGAST